MECMTWLTLRSTEGTACVPKQQGMETRKQTDYKANCTDKSPRRTEFSGAKTEGIPIATKMSAGWGVSVDGAVRNMNKEQRSKRNHNTPPRPPHQIHLCVQLTSRTRVVFNHSTLSCTSTHPWIRHPALMSLLQRAGTSVKTQGPMGNPAVGQGVHADGAVNEHE